MLLKCVLWTIHSLNMVARGFIPPIMLQSDSRLRPNSMSSLLEHNTAIFADMLSRAVNSPEFRCTVWQRQPQLFCYDKVVGESLFGTKQLEHTLETEFFDAGRGCFNYDRTGWAMAPVSTPTGSAIEDARLQYKDVVLALKVPNGTVVVNSAGAYIPQLARYCLSATHIIQLPVAINVYVTAPGQSTSAPLHTDKQDVFVFQTEGCKHWRVFAPPEPRNMPRADPYARGKGSDLLHSAELRGSLTQPQPLVDVTLTPGQVLYVPAGFPHTTDTLSGNFKPSEPSVHLTLGVDTLVWGLTYAQLRSMALKRAGLEDKLRLLTKLPADKYWALQAALPLGFLGENSGDLAKASESAREKIVRHLLHLMRAVEPARWGGVGAGNSAPNAFSDADAQLAQQLHLHEVVSQAVEHHYHITQLFSSMYRDVAHKITPVQRDLSLFRSQKLETTMADYGELYPPPTKQRNRLK